MSKARWNKGMEVLRKIDPEMAELLPKAFKNTSTDLSKLAIEFAYGDVLSRDGLDIKTRELLNIAILGALGYASLQLEGHVRAALNAGASKMEIVEVVLQIAVYAGFPAAFNALLVLEKLVATTQSP